MSVWGGLQVWIYTVVVGLMVIRSLKAMLIERLIEPRERRMI